MKILVVDDNPMVCDVMAEMLRQAGHEVTACGDGADAIALLSREPFDLLVTDVILPRRSGFDIADHIRARNPGIPILAVSGHRTDVVRRAAGESGQCADITLYKPFEEKDLLAAVESLRRRTPRAEEG